MSKKKKQQAEVKVEVDIQQLVDDLYFQGMRPTCEVIIKHKLQEICRVFSGKERDEILARVLDEVQSTISE